VAAGAIMTDKKPIGMIITIIILLIIVLALGLSILSNINPLDNVVRKYQRTYPDSLLSIQRVAGDNALALNKQIITYCPDFNLNEYFLAQMDNLAMQKSTLFVVNPAGGKIECTIDRSTNINKSKALLNQNLIATINDEPVYMDEVTAVYNNIPANMRTNTSLQDSLEQVISNKLLLQDAVKKGINVKEEDIDNAVSTFLSNNGLTLDQLNERLTSSSSSINTFRNSIRNNLLLQKEINEATKNSTLPAEADLKAYYEENKQGFMTKAKATTKQLLLYANESNSDAKLEEIKAIASQLNSTNFCELVSKYSQDLISIPRCGLYDFEQGQLLPEYEQVVFNSEPGTSKIIKTSLGYHIVQIINVTLPQQLSYEQVKNDIINYFVLRNKQQLLIQYISTLKQQAKIVSYIS
jgi:peptidyl-prolyl cis-trans isomerase SurA